MQTKITYFRLSVFNLDYSRWQFAENVLRALLEDKRAMCERKSRQKVTNISHDTALATGFSARACRLKI